MTLAGCNYKWGGERDRAKCFGVGMVGERSALTGAEILRFLCSPTHKK